MKILLLTIILTSCASKYNTYPIIDKRNFKKDNPVAGIISKRLLPSTNKRTVKRCFSQFFWNKNAKKDSLNFLPMQLNGICRKNNYLMNTTIRESWWTTIVYSRSCIEVKTTCPRN
ncbi:MAG: hypothetical protein N4A33_04220 [Bacteriovoracaceae bacterium]|jgi:hypothetical protein|nr:hypothetical protein [Bacteriovoracaceae bacterium]